MNVFLFQFIQKDPQLPALNLFISIPNKMTNYLSAVLYYSQQHLQAVLSLAKFKVSDFVFFF